MSLSLPKSTAKPRYFRCSKCNHRLAFITNSGDIIGTPGVGVEWKARCGQVAVRCGMCYTWVTIPKEAEG